MNSAQRNHRKNEARSRAEKKGKVFLKKTEEFAEYLKWIGVMRFAVFAQSGRVCY